MLTVTDLSVRYGMHEALASVSLEVSRDEIVVILGANGAGKSTLLSAIAGNCAGETEGRITLDGENLLALDAAQIVAQGIAFVPEGRGVFADLSVEENLQLGSYAEHARTNEHQNLQEVLSLFPKLEERKKQIVRTMSGGEQQMVAIGRALMSAPTILMLDEPSLGLSPLLCKELFTSLKKVRDSGVGILLVEQNARQSLSISDRGYLLGNGKILGHNSAENLLNDSTVQAAYLGGAVATHSTATMAPPDKVEGKRSDSPEPALAIKTITPDNKQHTAQTVSSDSLLDEDIDALVARAGSSATRLRETDAALPMQVVKLTAGNPAVRPTSAGGATSSSVPGMTSSGMNGSGMSSSGMSTGGGQSFSAVDLPQTNDAEVQAMLAEFEAAARRAAWLSSAGVRDNSKSLPETRTDQHEDPALLPHIPVYKKSPVTVYRRDGGGELRKQE